MLILNLLRCVRAQGTNYRFCDDASTHLLKASLNYCRGLLTGHETV